MTGNKTGPKGPSKPLTDKEYEQMMNMIRIQCTRDEICFVMDMSDTTLNRRLKERGVPNFEALYKKHSSEGNVSIRRGQWNVGVNKENPGMLIWLGKQYLGQKDHVEAQTNITRIPFDGWHIESATKPDTPDAD